VREDTNAPSHSLCGLKPLQLNASVGRGELPISLGVMLVAVVLPGGDFLDQGLPIGDSPIEALRRQHGQFGFSQIQPTAVFRRVVPIRTARRAGASRYRASATNCSPSPACWMKNWPPSRRSITSPSRLCAKRAFCNACRPLVRVLAGLQPASSEDGEPVPLALWRGKPGEAGQDSSGEPLE